MFRYMDKDNYYRFSWDKQRNERRLVKKAGGVFTLLAADNVPYVVGQNHQVEVVAQGSQLEVWVDGARIFQITDPAHNRGSVAFYTWMNNGAYFDDLVVEDLSGGNFNALPKITVLTASPATILDMEMSNLTVEATDPDDGPQALSYQWSIVSGAGVLDNASSATPVYTPADGVGTQSVTLKVEVSDGAATVSGNLTLTVEDANPPPLGPELLKEDFSGATLTGWSVRDEGTLSAPSKWRIVSGELMQQTNIRDGGAASALPHLGTYLSYDAGLAWTDYRAKFKLRSTDDDSLGLMFRFQDNDNYYRFSWDKQLNQRRLVKKAGGVFSLLAADNVPYVMEQNYQVEIVAQGGLLEVWVDGVRIFQVNDDAHAQGSIAFYTWMNNAAFFDDVKVNVIE
jgi:PKD repeat protein